MKNDSYKFLDLVLLDSTVFMVLGNLFGVISVSWWLAFAPIVAPIVFGVSLAIYCKLSNTNPDIFGVKGKSK